MSKSEYYNVYTRKNTIINPLSIHNPLDNIFTDKNRPWNASLSPNSPGSAFGRQVDDLLDEWVGVSPPPAPKKTTPLARMEAIDLPPSLSSWETRESGGEQGEATNGEIDDSSPKSEKSSPKTATSGENSSEEQFPGGKGARSVIPPWRAPHLHKGLGNRSSLSFRSTSPLLHTSTPPHHICRGVVFTVFIPDNGDETPNLSMGREPYILHSMQYGGWQVEKCKQTGRIHVQGWAYAKDAKTYGAWHKILDSAFPWGVVWLKSMKGTPWDNYVYTTKEDTRFDFAEYMVKKTGCDHLRPQWPNSFQMAPPPNNKKQKVVQALINPLDEINGEDNLYTYQKEIWQIIRGPVDKRKVYWYYDPKGDCGKSFLTRCLVMNEPGTTWVATGKSADIMKAIQTVVDGVPGSKGKAPVEGLGIGGLRTVIIDVPRVCHHVPYASMEQLKNGNLFCSKYESGSLLINPVHTIVFSNSLPEWSTMSEDRWCVYKLTRSDGDVTSESVPYGQQELIPRPQNIGGIQSYWKQ